MLSAPEEVDVHQQTATATTGEVVQAMDGIGLIGTVGFFGPAAVVIAILAVIVIRDRRSPQDDDETSAT